VLGFVLVTLDVILRGPLVAFDHLVDPWVLQHVPHDVIVVVRRYVVLPGQRAVNVPPMAFLAAILAWRRGTWRPLAVPLVVMVVLALVVPGMKLWTGRTNPLSGADLMWAGGTEYPSGHTINAIVVWGMTFAFAACLDWKVGRWLTPRRRTALTAAMTVLIGCSVLVARTHWLTDVIGSVFFGVALLWAVLRFGLTGLGAGERVRRTPSGPGRLRARASLSRRARPGG
jgi:membrane-associated phospholipid phosphatase